MVFRFFEDLVDPYQPFAQTDTPPRQLWPFLRGYIRPFRRVFAATGLLSVIVAFADVALIWYVGRLVDLLAVPGRPDMARRYNAPVLKGPFNLDARRAAGFTEEELAALRA